MPPRRKSALEELIRQGLVADGELLRYKVLHAAATGAPLPATASAAAAIPGPGAP